MAAHRSWTTLKSVCSKHLLCLLYKHLEARIVYTVARNLAWNKASIIKANLTMKRWKWSRIILLRKQYWIYKSQKKNPNIMNCCTCYRCRINECNRITKSHHRTSSLHLISPRATHCGTNPVSNICPGRYKHISLKTMLDPIWTCLAFEGVQQGPSQRANPGGGGWVHSWGGFWMSSGAPSFNRHLSPLLDGGL